MRRSHLVLVTLLGALLAAPVLIGPSVAAAAPGWAVIQLATDTNSQANLRLSGDRVVWQGSDGTNYQIFTQQIGVDASPVPLTTDARDHTNPAVSGDRVVWQGSDGAHDQIFTQQIGVDDSPVKLTADAYGDYAPQVSGDRVVWWDGFDCGYSYWRAFTQQIGVDAAPVQLDADTDPGYGPQVSGDRVAWVGSGGIMAQQIGVDASPAQLTDTSYSQDSPQVSGDRVVWQGFDGTNHQVYTQKIGTDPSPVQLTHEPNDGYYCWPQVSGDRVVWEGWDGAHTQIYTEKIGVDAAPVQLTSDAHEHDYPQVSGDLVVWQGSDGANTQIYAQRIGPDTSPVQLTSDALDHTNPQVSGDRIVWQAFDGTNYQIFAASPDTTPPVTTLSASPDPNAAGWNHSAVTVSLDASDGATGSGIWETLFELDSGPETPYTAPLTISAEGVHTITYGSEDNAGNPETPVSATIGIDKTAPLTTCKAGSYTGTATIHLSPADATSGVATTLWSLDGTTWNSGTTVGLPAPKTYTLRFRSTDYAGNVEAVKSVTVVVNRYTVKATKSPTGSLYTLRRRSGVATWTFTGIFKTSAGVVAGKSVVLQRSTNGTTWKTASKLSTNTSGKAAKKLTFRTKGTTYWRWYCAANATYRAATGAKTKIVVR